MDSSKHAYLIMAHHRPDLLRKLLNAIDDKRNDIYLHIDKKADSSQFNLAMEHSRLQTIEPVCVNWGGYSQVRTTLKLLHSAVESGKYQYYHFMTGSTFPLKNQDEMHSFFSVNEGKEFIGFVSEEKEKKEIYRVRYHSILPEAGIKEGLAWKVLHGTRLIYYSIQKLCDVDYFKKYNMKFKKGVAYWSITNDLAKYILENEEMIEEMLSHSVSGDEVFVQTLAWNSQFISSLYSTENEWEGSQRECTWARPGHNFTNDDLCTLLNSEKCFALKFEGPEGIKLIEQIRKCKSIN